MSGETTLDGDLSDRFDDADAAGHTLERAQMLAKLQRRMFDEESDPPEIGRFKVVGRLGAGAMGVVFEAHDPQLDRRVALKLLHGEKRRSADAAARMLREAQTLAKLSHSNVVAVHDVGEHGDGVFVAMEFVDGVDVDEWLKQEKRGWAEVLRVFIQAGRGLAAAHASDLVHRDFKPANVLIDHNGRVRVADFGLARAADPTPSLENTDNSQDTIGEIPTQLTRTGALVGTPAYMAPEQFAGDPADARSDQFSFCVALHEALYGVRPFRGETVAEIVVRIGEGAGDPPSDAEVPAWLRSVVLRGLRVRPEDRFVSMNALVGALTRDRTRARRRWLLGLGGVGLVVAGAWWGSLTDPCTGLKDELQAAWNPAAKQALADAFVATGHAEAERSVQTATAALDDFAERWGEERTAACVATRVEGQQSEMLLDRRVLCLQRSRFAFEAALRRFEEPTIDTVSRAKDIAPDAAHLDACGPEAVLTAGNPPPPDTESRQILETVERGIAEANALFNEGSIREVVEQLASLEEDAGRAGHEPTLARLRLWQGRALTATKEPEPALAAALDAEVHADRGRADQLRAKAAILSARRLVDLDRHDEARHALSRADAARRRLGVEDLALEIDLELSWEHLEAATGNLDGAREHIRNALGMVEGTGFTDREVLALTAMGRLEFDVHNYSVAREFFAQAHEIHLETLGPDHPATARISMSLGSCAVALGRLDEAHQAFEESLNTRLQYVPEDDPTLAGLYQNIGVVAIRRSDPETALLFFQRAYRIRQPTVPAGSTELAPLLINMGYAHTQLESFDRALSVHSEALQIRVAGLGSDHPLTGNSHYALGHVLSRLGRHKEALEHYQRSLQIGEATSGKDHPAHVAALSGMGDCHLELGRTREASEVMERALALSDHPDVEPRTRATVELNTARSLRARNREPQRADDLARSALARLEGQEGSDPERVKIERFIAGDRPSDQSP